MKTLKLTQIGKDLILCVQKYPLAVLSSMLTTLFFVIAIEIGDEPGQSWLVAGIISLTVFPYVLALHITRQYYYFKPVYVALFFVLVVALSFWFHSVVLNGFSTWGLNVCHITYIIATFLLGFLLISLIPFFNVKNNDHYSSFHRQLLVRIFDSFLYSTFLFFALFMGILAVNNLLNFEYDSRVFGHFAVVCYMFFGFLYFLTGIPERDIMYEPSKSVRFFTINILTPVVTVYGLILFLYGINFLFVKDATIDGYFGWIIIFYISAFLCFLMLRSFPSDDHHPVKNIFIWSYPRFIPVLALLMMITLFHWIGANGLNEWVYVSVSLSIYLFIIGIIFIFYRDPDMRLLPIIFAVFLLISTIGPQSMCPAGLRSQFNKLEEKLTTAGALNNNALSPVVFNEYNLRNEIQENLYYFEKRNAIHWLTRWDLDALGQIDGPIVADNLMKTLDVEYDDYYRDFISINHDHFPPIDLSTYEKALSIITWSQAATDQEYVYFDFNTQCFSRRLLNKELHKYCLSRELVKELATEKPISFVVHSEGEVLEIIIRSVDIRLRGDNYEFSALEGFALFRKVE